MGLRILHSADWHLDSPFTGFSPEQRRYLKDELAKIPEKIADLCRKRGCDLMLLAGDLFDGPYTKESVAVLKDALERCGVPVFISPGNHDFCGPGSPWLEEVWPENVHIFKGKLESVTVPSLNCRVYGGGYTAMDCPGLLEDFRAEGAEAYCVAVLHGDAMQLKSPYCPVTASQVRESGLNYLALGHIHKYGAFRSGATVCGWPGCPMGQGWDETGEKGVYIVELEDTAVVHFLSLHTPRFYEVEADSAEALDRALPAGGSQDFYRITLTGSWKGEMGEILGRFPNMQLRDLREAPVDLWANAGADTLEGTYFRMLRETLELSDGEAAATVQLAAEISRKLLEGKEVALP